MDFLNHITISKSATAIVISRCNIYLGMPNVWSFWDRFLSVNHWAFFYVQKVINIIFYLPSYFANSLGEFVPARQLVGVQHMLITLTWQTHGVTHTETICEIQQAFSNIAMRVTQIKEMV